MCDDVAKLQTGGDYCVCVYVLNDVVMVLILCGSVLMIEMDGQ